MARVTGITAIDELGLETPFGAEIESEERLGLGLLEAVDATPFNEGEAGASAADGGGRLVVAEHPLLASHRGTPPDLILRWNAIARAGSVDAVVHFHGYSSHKRAMRIDSHKEPHSGLDWGDPTKPGSRASSAPVLTILPRGNYFGGRSGAGYNFPALVRPGALDTLVRDALARVSRVTGHRLERGRLILTAHSGGGAAVAAILTHTDPEEVHIFDGTYGSRANVVRWARLRIERELAVPSARPPAMRVLYRPGTQTAPQAEAIAREVCKSLQSTAGARLRPLFRVDATRVEHNQIPSRFGWRLLADPSADLPETRPRACASAVARDSAAAYEEPEASQRPETDREESQQETIPVTEQEFFTDDESDDIDRETEPYAPSESESLSWLDVEDEAAASEGLDADRSEALAYEGGQAPAQPESLNTEDEGDAESEAERFGELERATDAEWEEEDESRDEQPLHRKEGEWRASAALEAEVGLASSGLSAAERKSVEITSTFETGRRGGFHGLSGNFDGQGLSFGLVNWTIGTGSLQPLLRDFAREHRAQWDAVFGADSARFLAMIGPKGDSARKDQHRFAIEEMNTSTLHNGRRLWRIREPWATYFDRLAKAPEFRRIQLRYVRKLLTRAAEFCRQFGLASEAAFAFMFDAVASHGKYWLTKKIRARRRREILLRERLQLLARQHGDGRIPEREILLAIADVLGATSAPRWAAKVRQRKRWFVTGEHPRAKELRGLEPRLDVPYTTSSAMEALDEAFEPDNAEYGYEGEQLAAEMTILEGLLETEAGAGTNLAERVKGIAAFVLGPTLQRGSAGPGVATLQRSLAYLGHPLTVNGSFDSATEQAVGGFQLRSGLTRDGVVGPRTKAAIAAAVRGGAAPSPTLAPVPSGLGAAIARVAEQEYRRWHSATPKLRETDRAAVPILQQYYRDGVNRNVSAAELQDTAWQGQHPWSAVFVSFVIRTAGAGAAFKYSAAHQSYIAAARRNRLQGITANPFWAYRATEVAPQVGDLVCASRSNSGATYENIGDARSRATHCDVVTEVRAGSFRVIGGNVNQRVDAKTVRMLPDGRVALDGKQVRIFAVLRCRGPLDASAQPLAPIGTQLLTVESVAAPDAVAGF